MRLDLKTVLPTFIPDKDNISLFLTMFERQMKLLNIPADFWVSHLIGVLPSNIGRLIAREPEEMFRNYAHIHNILLQRFKLTADRFRDLFCRHQKQDHSTWKDFFFELRTLLEGWLKELEIDSFETLKDFIIADQIKKRCPPDYKNHFLDTWEILNDPVVLAEKLDSYENVKPSSQKLTKLSNSRFSRNTGNPEVRKSHSFKVEKNVSVNHYSAFANPSYMPARNTNTGFHPPISCYGCGNPGFIKSKCPKCSLKKESASVNAIHMFTCLTSPVALLDIEVYEATGTVCADTGASHEIPLHTNTVDETETNDLHLREEGQALNVEERNDLMVLLNESKDVFRLGGEPTPFVKHFINTGNNPPVSTAPYRLSPNRKEHLRKEIDNLLVHNIIE
ncbi:uncharacterized protein TNCV_410511 [Trichonephila clavipes]|nr:uncharacterized protein TNCV_410511 [Trichonephila clavipes]